MAESISDNHVEWVVFNPTAEREERVASGARRLEDLGGKKIGLFWNGKYRGDFVLETVAELLGERFADITFDNFPLFLGVGDENIKRMAQCDAVIAAVGD